VGRQKRWTSFDHDVLYVGYRLLTCVLAKKGLGINCYYICAIKPKSSYEECVFNLFFSQKQFQLSLLILLCFHLLIISASQL